MTMMWQPTLSEFDSESRGRLDSAGVPACHARSLSLERASVNLAAGLPVGQILRLRVVTVRRVGPESGAAAASDHGMTVLPRRT